MGEYGTAGAAMKTIIALVLLLLLALGAYVFSVRISMLDEDMVYAYYQDNINATRGFDAKKVCAMYDKSFRAIDISQGPTGEVRLSMNRKQACDATRESFEMLAKVVKASRVEPEFKYTIETVTISPDRKQATVKIRALMRIGKNFSITTKGTETLVRRFGVVRSVGSETKSVVSMR